MIGHVCSMRKVFKILVSQPYLAAHVNRTETSSKHRRQTVFVIENSANIKQPDHDAKCDLSVFGNSHYYRRYGRYQGMIQRINVITELTLNL